MNDMIRDPRWINVYGYIGPPEIHPYDLETGYTETLERQIEVRVEVVYKGNRIYSVIHIDKDAPELIIPEINFWKFVLDDIVKQIDKELDKYDSR